MELNFPQPSELVTSYVKPEVKPTPERGGEAGAALPKAKEAAQETAQALVREYDAGAQIEIAKARAEAIDATPNVHKTLAAVFDRLAKHYVGKVARLSKGEASLVKKAAELKDTSVEQVAAKTRNDLETANRLLDAAAAESLGMTSMEQSRAAKPERVGNAAEFLANAKDKAAESGRKFSQADKADRMAKFLGGLAKKMRGEVEEPKSTTAEAEIARLNAEITRLRIERGQSDTDVRTSKKTMIEEAAVVAPATANIMSEKIKTLF